MEKTNQPLTPILELRHITKTFPGVKALDNVSCQIFTGEVHALLGENGAGKSTMIKVMTGVHQPSEGEILLNGQPIQFNDPRDSRHHGIAAIYQEPSLFPDLDIAENIFIGRQPMTTGRRVDWGRMYAQSKELLASLGVRLDPKTKARSLSVADQQMVEIARALSVKANILIMDEPTSSLTKNEVKELFKIVHQLRTEGTAIVFISHRLEELFEMADRVTVLRDGGYIGTERMDGVTTEQLIQMMVGRKLTELFPKETVDIQEVLLEVEHLSRTGLFEDVSFQLHKGEILGLAGLIGAGRTDVARAIFGVEPATSGTIKIGGQPITMRNPQQAMELGVAYVPEDRQHHGLVLPLPIAQNISLPSLGRFANRGWLNTKKERASAQESATQLEVKATSVEQLAGQLSGGNQQKVVLAKWLATNPSILILDEPTRGIDVGTKAAIYKLMGDLAKQGLAILMISSELPEILGLSDRVLVMREGHITGQFSRAEATQEKIMRAALE